MFVCVCVHAWIYDKSSIGLNFSAKENISMHGISSIILI